MRILFSLLVLFVLTANAHCRTGRIIMRVIDFRPQYFQDEDGTWTGLAVELARVLANEAGVALEFQPLPWKRALAYMKNGRIDLMTNLSLTEGRRAYISFIGPMRDETMVLVVPEETDYNIRGLDDLKLLPRKIGIEDNAFYGSAFNAKYNSDPHFAARFDPVVRAELNIAKLIRGRLSGFIEDRYSASGKIKNDIRYARLKIHPFFINQDWVYFGFSKQSVPKERLGLFQDAFARARAKGLFKKVLEQYR